MRVYTSAAAVKDSPSKLAYVFQSQGCDSFYFQRVGRKVPLSVPPPPPPPPAHSAQPCVMGWRHVLSQHLSSSACLRSPAFLMETAAIPWLWLTPGKWMQASRRRPEGSVQVSRPGGPQMMTARN